MSLKKLLFILTLLPTIGLAENLTTIPGGYTVHHNAFLSSDLSPEMTKAYGVARSANRAMLNVSVIKEMAGTTGTPVKAKVEVTATNTRGQVRTIPMREIVETGAVYYIGDFLVENQEDVKFAISVQPEGAGPTQHLDLQQQFFTK